jgi:hypothetical protein
MSSYTMTIFIAPPEVAKVTGRYICLLQSESDEKNRFLAEDSIVELAKSLADQNIDWSFVEKDLLEKGIFKD